LLLGFRRRLIRHAQELPLSHHGVQGIADAHYRIQKDAAAIQVLLIDDALALVGAALTVELTFSVILWLDWQLGFVAVLVTPALLFLAATSSFPTCAGIRFSRSWHGRSCPRSASTICGTHPRRCCSLPTNPLKW
jgi:ABC-type multidrug transport system fused ATPase/permease subunit